MNNKRAFASLLGILGVMAVSTVFIVNNSKNSDKKKLIDDALLSLIKNDLKGFEAFIAAGGNVHDVLPEIDGQRYTVAQGISYFERSAFAAHLYAKKIPYVRQDEKNQHDIMTIAMKKNNPELLGKFNLENPRYDLAYGTNGWTLLHMASAACSHKLVPLIFGRGKVSWDHKAKDGSTPLTLAAENDCLPVLSFLKEQGADFRAKNGKGKSALAILSTKKDAALAAFAKSFEQRSIATVSAQKAVAAPVPDFYKKRKIPKDQVVDHAALLEPEDRPLEATETAENSEFAD